MTYEYALVAYEKDTRFLYLSIVLSELIHNSMLDVLGDDLAFANTEKHPIKRKNILSVFKVSGIKMPTYYYYDWYIERVAEFEDQEVSLDFGEEEDVTRDG